MADQKVWTKEEILEMWPQAKVKLQGFQRHLERNAGITASQLGMALQLAELEFNRLSNLPGFHDLANQVCPELRDNFLRFVNMGEAANEYIVHIDYCPKCKKAIESAFERQARALENLARIMNKKARRDKQCT